MGCGISSGENRAIEAAQKAISSPLLEGINIKGAKSVLLNVTGSSNLTMQEINEGNNVIFEAAGEEANVIFGCVRKEEMNDYVSYTVIATGFDGSHQSFGAKNSQNAQSNSKGPDNFRGGFNFLENEINTEDLEVPTILRVKSPKSTLEDKTEETSNPQSGFNFEASRYNWAKEKTNKVNAEDNNKDDDESSSFLRMIMD
jgi:cell division protein FtsZ